uniref:(northern house mosquito) hypothetical protein n=1 Tax=Culex pipiens TaxID=7175 RepID=A0A8D8ASF6_CULPI
MKVFALTCALLLSVPLLAMGRLCPKEVKYTAHSTFIDKFIQMLLLPFQSAVRQVGQPARVQNNAVRLRLLGQVAQDLHRVGLQYEHLRAGLQDGNEAGVLRRVREGLAGRVSTGL